MMDRVPPPQGCDWLEPPSDGERPDSDLKASMDHVFFLLVKTLRFSLSRQQIYSAL